MDIINIQVATWGAIVGFSIGCLGNILATAMLEYGKPNQTHELRAYYHRILKSAGIITAIFLGLLIVIYFLTLFYVK